MKTVRAVFEAGVFRPTQPVDLPECAEVEFEPRVVGGPHAEQIDALSNSNPGLAKIYEILSHRHSSGHHDTAERHNEHQP